MLRTYSPRLRSPAEALAVLPRTGLRWEVTRLLINPVLEYACPVWHTIITNEQCIRLESIHRRAVCIINGVNEDYTTFCNRRPTVA